MNSPSDDTGIEPNQRILKEIIRSAVTQNLSREVVTPCLDLSDLLIGVAVYSFPLRDESANQVVVTLYGSLFTRGIGMGKIDQRFA